MSEKKVVKTIPTAVMLSILSAIASSGASAAVPTFEMKHVQPMLLDATTNTLSRLPAPKLRQLQTAFSVNINLLEDGETTRRKLFMANLTYDSEVSPTNPGGVMNCYGNCYVNCHTDCHSDCGGNDI